MLAALLRYSRPRRRDIARQWAYRSHAVRAVARIACEPDPDTLRRRALDDARGQLVREGVTYHGDGRVTSWQIQRSVLGRTDQFDIIINGVLSRTGGARRIRCWLGRPSA